MKPKIAFFGSDQYSEIVWQALSNDFRFQTAKAPPAHLSLEKIKNQLRKFKPEVGVLASFGKILDRETLKIPPHGILNLHPSLLPKYRGPAPVPAAILNGESQTGLSIIKMDKKLDHGPIVAQIKEKIRPGETAEALLERLFTLGAQVLLAILPAYLEGKIEPQEQNHPQASYCQRLTRSDGRIDWQKPADYLERFIRAMFPWPGAWTKVEINQNSKRTIKRLKIHQAHLEKGKLILDQVQLEGKKPVSFKQFNEGYPGAKLI